MLTLAAYQAYATRPFSIVRYLLVVVCFLLGLASKPMLVTVPLVLLLLDYWPLRRIGGPGRQGRGDAETRRHGEIQIPASPRPRVPGSSSFPPEGILRLVLEKVPLLALTVISCLLTTWAQSLVAAFKPLDFKFRVGNALLSYAAYIGQTFYPVCMVVHYPHPGPNLRLVETLLPLAVLLSITALVVWLGWRRRYLLVGWFWYLGMLVPVIGLMQVGARHAPTAIPTSRRSGSTS